MKLKTRLGLCSLLAALGVVIGSTNVQAQTTFAANDGDWSDLLNWNNGVPAAGTHAGINDGRTIDVTPGAVVGLLDIGTGAGQTGNLNIGPGADLTSGPDAGMRLGVGVSSAAGHVTMTGGTVTIQGGLNTGLVNGDIIIGDNGTGTWTMDAGTLSVPDEILLGAFNAAADGTLTVNDGAVTVGRGIVAGLFSGKGALNVNGGTVTNQLDMSIGFLGDSKGTLKVTDGVVNVNKTLWIGRDTGALGNGVLDVSGGTINVAVDLLSSVGGATSSTLTQSGGTINIGQHFIHGLNKPSTYTQTGGAVNVNGANSRLTVAEADTAASWDLQDGSITSTHIFLGDLDNSHGTMKVSGGSISLRGNLNVGAALASNAPPDNTRINTQGQAAHADGTFIVSGDGSEITVGGNFLANPGDKTRPPADANLSNLVFEIFSSAGTSLIDVDGAADLDGALIDLDLMGGYTPTLDQEFVLLTALAGIGGDTGFGTTKSNGSTGEAFTLAAEDAANWILSVRSNGGLSESLVASYVPEPSSLALLAVSAAALLLRSRKRLAN
jgi:hypothetical protein